MTEIYSGKTDPLKAIAARAGVALLAVAWATRRGDAELIELRVARNGLRFSVYGSPDVGWFVRHGAQRRFAAKEIERFADEAYPLALEVLKPKTAGDTLYTKKGNAR